MAKITGKEWYFSKTILIAIAQAVISIIVAVIDVNPGLKIAGGLLVIKSALDIVVRLNTSEKIS
mgnify:CR=1 FL=1